ncbi:MAG: DMT family transporter [Gammaproteobacteria bacterium]|nr:DMT family transporter [Gammaproteobacteria bacterium]
MAPIHSLHPQKKAYLFAVLTVLLWSTVATAFKLSLLYLSPLQLLFYANLTSILTLLILLGMEGRFSELWNLTMVDLRQGLLLGLLNPLLYYLILLHAYDLLPAQIAQPINYTWAITLSLLSVPLLGHRLSGIELVSILICYGGVVVILTGGDSGALGSVSSTGVMLALSSTLVWALYWIFNTKSHLDPLVSLLLNFVFALPFTALLVWVTVGFEPADLRGLAGAVYVGVFEMGVAFVLWLKAMRLTHSTVKIASLIYFAPFLSLILIHLLVGETIRGSSVMGLILIVLGNLLQQAGHSRKRGEVAK